MPKDPLGYDTNDFKEAAGQMADDALSGVNDDAVADELARVRQAFAGDRRTAMGTSYEVDFVKWTQEQAALLRALPADTGLDIENLAEEIEAAGRREIKEVSQALLRILSHLIRVAIAPENDAAVYYDADMAEQLHVFRYSVDIVPVSRQYIDLPQIWRLAVRNAKITLEELRVEVPSLPESCPLSLDHLLGKAFDHREATATIKQAIEAKTRG
ncbi:DUF29 domain-containing protein [Rhizobium leguminosarum bv. viciae]|nr:DUF29 domain-containing protein [Rhizobium leguminosarum bv. viciae]